MAAPSHVITPGAQMLQMLHILHILVASRRGTSRRGTSRRGTSRRGTSRCCTSPSQMAWLDASYRVTIRGGSGSGSGLRLGLGPGWMQVTGLFYFRSVGCLHHTPILLTLTLTAHAERSCMNVLCKTETKTAKCKSNPNLNPTAAPPLQLPCITLTLTVRQSTLLQQRAPGKIGSWPG